MNISIPGSTPKVAAASVFAALVLSAACGGDGVSRTATERPSRPVASVAAAGIPPAAAAALEEYVVEEHAGTLVGECAKATEYGWCYFNMTPSSGALVLDLGRVGAGLPTWRITLEEEDGKYRITDVRENQGRE
ncbi:MAG: hypothetical protein IH609_11690 [Dehalococcoidia bacterium]|nr:hypothetical protein [Dehalococcoidia bacterium]